MKQVPHRPLPGEYLDLLAVGISKEALKGRGDRAVDYALMQVALSAVGRGWEKREWLRLVQDPGCRLGQQAKLHKGRPRGDEGHVKYLNDVWKRALSGHVVQKKRDRTAFIVDAENLIREWDAWLAAHPASLDYIDAQIVCAFLDQIAKVGSRRVSYPRHRLLEETCIPEYRLRQRLRILEAEDLLVRVERGCASKNPEERRANVFVLCDPSTFVAKRGDATPAMMDGAA